MLIMYNIEFNGITLIEVIMLRILNKINNETRGASHTPYGAKPNEAKEPEIIAIKKYIYLPSIAAIKRSTLAPNPYSSCKLRIDSIFKLSNFNSSFISGTGTFVAQLTKVGANFA
jgi:hypothetical protein